MIPAFYDEFVMEFFGIFNFVEPLTNRGSETSLIGTDLQKTVEEFLVQILWLLATPY